MLAELADGSWTQPIQFDPAGGSWAGSAVHSPLWIPRLRQTEGSWEVPPGRQDRERMAAALAISFALIAASLIK
ncbi:MAG: hypothetical protein NTY35_04540 [Planctomycetota bacterium]|nr:hypothetical protein [Planctomycetota bacterium]